MFTGIVQGLCPVVRISDEPSIRRIAVALGDLAEGVALGASVAINGTCLTVTAVQDGEVSFDVIRETLSLTNLGGSALAIWSMLNGPSASAMRSGGTFCPATCPVSWSLQPSMNRRMSAICASARRPP
jgi:hypothetical protein